MKTYADLLKAGQSENDRMEFITDAISEHKASPDYKLAVDASLYYDGENPTISRYEKIIYDMLGNAHRDIYTPNHKIKSQFFGFAVDQEVSYLLGNGVTFNNEDTLEKLGPEFCEKTCDTLTNAEKQGLCFGFWNYDHVEVFQFADTPGEPGFVPLWDDSDGLLKAGIRYWQSGETLRATLYELDGITDYIQQGDRRMEVQKDKRSYITVKRSATLTEGETLEPGRNYPSFPIIPMVYNGGHSAIRGKRNTIDAQDLVDSKMVNNVDEGNLIYWVLTNCNGMDEEADANFIYQAITSHVLHANGDDGAKAEPHPVEAPFEGNKVTSDMLLKKLHQDFQTFNPDDIMANQTATAIKAAYVRLDLKADKTERAVTRWINGILAVAGIDDKPTYTRNSVSNTEEAVQTILSCAEYLPGDYITKKLLTLLGDADQIDEVLKQMTAEEADRYKQLEKELEEAKKQQSGESGQFGEEGEPE